MKKIALVSHGCAKNLVDSELILGLLAQNGYEITLNEDESDIVIVNTCSFICDAERESIRSILELVESYCYRLPCAETSGRFKERNS